MPHTMPAYLKLLLPYTNHYIIIYAPAYLRPCTLWPMVTPYGDRFGHVDWSSARSFGIHLLANISREMHKTYILDMSLKIINLRLQLYPRGNHKLLIYVCVWKKVWDAQFQSQARGIDRLNVNNYQQPIPPYGITMPQPYYLSYDRFISMVFI